MLKTNIHTHTAQRAAMSLLGTLLLASCSVGESEKIETSAADFASAYYNFRYNHALALCTRESEKWIRFQASNVRQADIDLYNSQQDSAQCSTADVEMSDDTTATAVVDVRNYVMTDSIVRSGKIGAKAQVKLILKKRGDKWLVNLTSLPHATATP